MGGKFCVSIWGIFGSLCHTRYLYIHGSEKKHLTVRRAGDAATNGSSKEDQMVSTSSTTTKSIKTQSNLYA